MSRPSFSRRAPSQVSPSPVPHAEEGRLDGDASPIAVAEKSNANEAVVMADDLAAQFLSKKPVDAVVPEAKMTPVDDLPAPPADQPAATARPPRFGSARTTFVAPAPAQAAIDPVVDGAAPAQDEAPTYATERVAAMEVPDPVAYEGRKGPFGKPGELSSAAVKALRSDVKSAAIVTDLVSSMALHPGSDADVAVKSKVLTSLLFLARQTASDLVDMVDPARADVGWVKAQALSQTASMIAGEWSRESMDAEEVRRRMEFRMSVVRSILMDEGGEVERALGDFAEGDRYKECTDAQSASDHRAVAIHQAAWALVGAIGSVRDERGEVFSFGMPQEAVVALLLQQVVATVTASRPEIRDPEASITYLRGAMRRATSLISAEYKGRAIEACSWVDSAVGEQQRAQRANAAPKMFAEQAIPFIAQWGMKNFQSIERASRKLIEESQDEQESSDRPGR